MKTKLYLVITLLAFSTLIVLPRGFAQGTLAQPSVRLVYFLPNDRPARPDRIEALRQLIKDTQQFYADEMERYGYGRKTFRVETDTSGVPVVHSVNGQFNNAHYLKSVEPGVWKEIVAQFEDFRHVYFIVIDQSSELLGGESCGLGAVSYFSVGGGYGFVPVGSTGVALRHRDTTAGKEILGGYAILPAAGFCFNDTRGFLHPLRVTTHELAHAFGLDHDFSDPDSAVGGRGFRFSKCDTEWLSVSRFFNSKAVSENASGNIQLISVPTYSPEGITLRFEVTDADGLHQAQLLVPEDGSWGPWKLIGCQALDGQTQRVEFLSSELTSAPERVMLQFMDDLGNITWATFLVDIASLLPPPKVVSIPDTNLVLPPPKVVSIPDTNLAAAVRKALGLTPNARITDHQMRELINLDAQSSQIKNLTGLEYATKLKSLELRKNQIQDIRPLANLKNLKELILEVNNVRDISPLANLTQLTLLYIAANPIPDFTPLANLTELTRLALWDNNISDVTLIADKVHLTHLHLWNNNISDISSLSNLTQLQVLHLEKNQIRDVSPLSGLTNLTELTLRGNPIADKSPLRTLKDRNPELKLDIEIPQLSPIVYIDTAQRPLLYWIDTASGTLYRLVGTEVESLAPGVRNATDLAIDMTGGKLYWTERTSDRTGKIRRANLDGTNVQLVKELTSVPHGIALDTVGDKIYLTNSWGKVQRLNVDGSNFESNLITGLEDLKDIAVDVLNHKIYWTEGKNRIRRANLDGSNIQTSATNLGTLGGIAIADGKLYWTKQTGENAGRIQRANLDGTNIQTLISLPSIPLGVTIDSAGRTLYWTSSQGTIQRANLNGSNTQVLVVGLDAPAGIALGTRDDIVATEAPLDKITGPWLWMIAPTETGQGGANSTNVDSLAAASGGNVTEADVAANGAREDDTVGDYAWTLGEIAAHGSDNLNDVINNIGMAQGDVDDHSAYALITLESIKVQSGVTMRVGSDDSIKVWLNGKVVHNKPINRGAQDFQDTFKVNLNKGDNLLLVKVSDRTEHWTMFVGIDANVKTKIVPAAPPVNATEILPPTDINEDGKVDKIDLLLVVTVLGESTPTNPRVDVDGDGRVTIADLLIVIGNLDDPVVGAAPTITTFPISIDVQVLEVHLNLLRVSSDGSHKYQYAIAILEDLLTSMRPAETQLLANYPNPFNPETWIPYQLSTAADVRLNIYSVTGRLIRTFALGHQPAGIYQNRSRAAYWDGRNESGEKVASGVYFYTLFAGDFTATRKMLIRK